ncbi:hypothetical protein FHS43_006149 [Streptosporangium becharense]|uniref:Uncharacterized protein n=1 Tax=Streptosporangium becharense TaxID=1816182 RepID=A0A7W9IGI5_9ACTN|nr:hypothetical protein [Streptosporangium becharense]MBB2914837.1 hypothetical protein [Streptosporangium becharense]MBB5820352.1 hypothetical protein [Streptosporangium becharense]
MIGRSRTPGRHRAGLAPAAVHRRLWDGPARAEAERLTAAWPGWGVLYSLGSRRFYAIAAWPVPEPLMVESDTPEELEERMREAETSFAWPALPVPPQSRHGGTALSQAHAAVPQVTHNAARRGVGVVRDAGGRSPYPARPRRPRRSAR